MGGHKEENRKRIFIYVMISSLFILTVILLHLAYTIHRTMPLYTYTKSNQRGWSGQVHRSDHVFGYVPIPNSSGAETFPVGDPIPMRYDTDSFRVPLAHEDNSDHIRPMLLTLGCSFTYGAAVHAENTFAYLVGKSLGGVTRNAGVCGYGLAQMIMLARQLIPQHRPDYLLLQYSPWLAERAITPFAPSYFGRVPTPYLAEQGGELEMQPPIFQTIVADLPVDDYRASPAGVVDFSLFLWHVGLPLFYHDDFHMGAYTLRRVLHPLPASSPHPDMVARYGYDEIVSVARSHGAEVIIVILGNDHRAVDIREDLFPRGVMVVNAQAELLKALPEITAEAYLARYAHWRDNPPRVVDAHPNEQAHRIIAETIVAHIKQVALSQPHTQLQGAR